MRILLSAVAIAIVLITAPANACKGCGTLSRLDAQWKAVTKIMLQMSNIDARYRLIQHVRGAPLWHRFPEERQITFGDLKNWHRAKVMFHKMTKGEFR